MNAFAQIRALVYLAIGVVAAQAQTVYDPAVQFSSTSNPTGVWSYGYTTTLGDAFFNLATYYHDPDGLDSWRYSPSSNPQVLHNPTTGTITPPDSPTQFFDAGSVGLHPGQNGELAIFRFTALSAGDYQIVGKFYGDDNHPTTTDVHVLVNGVSVFDSAVGSFGFVTGTSFDITATLGLGGTIDFAVGYGSNGNYAFDATGLSAQVTAIPEPSTYAALFSLSALGFAAYCRRRRRTG